MRPQTKCLLALATNVTATSLRTIIGLSVRFGVASYQVLTLELSMLSIPHTRTIRRSIHRDAVFWEEPYGMRFALQRILSSFAIVSHGPRAEKMGACCCSSPEMEALHRPR